jgi:hypothetical protein
MSVALDVGTALSALVIFLLLDLPGATLNWWGNTVYTKSEPFVIDPFQLS